MASIKEIDRYFQFAKELTLEAGKIMSSAYGRKKNVETKSSEWDLVTEYDRRVEDMLIRRLRQEFPEHNVRDIGSAALSLAYVAAGAIDVFQMDYLKPWDVAAGVLMVREAGGVVIDSRGGECNIMRPRTLAAANEKLARETAKLIVETDLKVQRKRLQRT
ncbi:inositol monophosphatase 2 [Cephus cinctus]|uniref:Inositol monophosphatase 2 n=1 Tax=Cephus cinctus TaxID=211228 RepID=A0AAJ7RPU3_CEPCN|nr:inositol monophosphatase 2 [Cephus cinctus]